MNLYMTKAIARQIGEHVHSYPDGCALLDLLRVAQDISPDAKYLEIAACIQLLLELDVIIRYVKWDKDSPLGRETIYIPGSQFPKILASNSI